MYRKPRFLKVLHEIRQQMARECDYDLDLFVQRLRLETSEPHLAEAGPSAPSTGASRRRSVKKKPEEKR
ncbi:MAG: hypothetical protein D6723_10095 [Acidobacteria bacterium]|nr:MAG: hypothetical protein D6723_10095 [Acidobacteriota bacterium]